VSALDRITDLSDVCFYSLVFTWIFWTAGAASITSALGGGLNCRFVPQPLVVEVPEKFSQPSFCILWSAERFGSLCVDCLVRLW